MLPLADDVVRRPLLELSDLDRAAAAFRAGAQLGSAWDEFRGRQLRLPSWFDLSLHAEDDAYLAQQDRLWNEISGCTTAYDAHSNELTPEIAELDALVRPGFYATTPLQASDHLIALGQLLRLSAVKAGDRVMEYGAGFGQIALTFARFGAIVDAVDISPDCCRAIEAQARWFDVPLSAYNGDFGYQPRLGEQYKLIIFYESFHHCRDFLRLIPQLRQMLLPDGRILLAGEPIAAEGTPEAPPYPWGMNLGAEAAAVMRIRGWYEMIFSEDYLIDCFSRHGFSVRKHPGMLSHYANAYELLLEPEPFDFGTWKHTHDDKAGWHHLEFGGRWTRSHTYITLDRAPTWDLLRLVTQNHHRQATTVWFRSGTLAREVNYEPGQEIEVLFERADVLSRRRLLIDCEAISPLSYGVPDSRQLGIFVKKIEYIRQP